jgi:hypothetical protein
MLALRLLSICIDMTLLFICEVQLFQGTSTGILALEQVEEEKDQLSTYFHDFLQLFSLVLK